MVKRIMSLLLAALLIVGCNASVSSTPQATSDLPYLGNLPTATFIPLPPSPTPLPQDNNLIAFPTSTEIPTPTGGSLSSPDGTYSIKCNYPELKIIKANGELVSNADIAVPDCQQVFHWAPNGSALLISYQFHLAYIWLTDGSQPLAINDWLPVQPSTPTSPFQVLWSPDSAYAVFSENTTTYALRPGGSNPAYAFPLEFCAPCQLSWITTKVLMVASEDGMGLSYNFIHVPTHDHLGTWWKKGKGTCAAQPPSFAPNLKWMIFEICNYADSPGGYSIVHMENGAWRELSAFAGNSLDFIGWNKDSTKFYMISRPDKAGALPDVRTPFGLLALDPVTLENQILFKNLWYAAFNTEMTWAYVVFPVKNNSGALNLYGGLWKLSTEEIIGKQIMRMNVELPAETVITPEEQTMYLPSGEALATSSISRARLLPAAWSHDNTRATTIDAAHDLIIIDINGKVQTINPLPTGTSWDNSKISWDDNDKSIQVNGETYAVP